MADTAGIVLYLSARGTNNYAKLPSALYTNQRYTPFP